MITNEEQARRMAQARQLAAAAWTRPTTEKIAMDAVLAEAFAETIYELMWQPNLGCATTRELLAELTARIEVSGQMDYSTVG
jgi:hypothetical protein